MEGMEGTFYCLKPLCSFILSHYPPQVEHAIVVHLCPQSAATCQNHTASCPGSVR